MIIVVRIVLESIDFISKSVIESLSEVGVCLVGIERSVRIRCIQKPTLAFFVGDNINDTTNGVRTKTYRYYTFIYFDAIGKVHGDIIQSKRASHPLLRYAINKYLDVLTTETVKHELHIRTYTTRFTEFHSRCFG